jgi:hypothetical protein
MDQRIVEAAWSAAGDVGAAMTFLRQSVDNVTYEVLDKVREFTLRDILAAICFHAGIVENTINNTDAKSEDEARFAYQRADALLGARGEDTVTGGGPANEV